MTAYMHTETMDDIRHDLFIEAMDDSKLCDCGAHMQTTTEVMEDHTILTRFICPDCGAESEQI